VRALTTVSLMALVTDWLKELARTLMTASMMVVARNLRGLL